MTTDAFKLTIHMVSSLDGFIEKKDRDVSWMESSDNYNEGVVLTDDDVAEFIRTIDCYIMGPGPMNLHWNWAGPMAIYPLSY